MLVILAGISCGNPEVFLHPEADPEFYETVGVVPFQTLASDRTAGQKLTIAFATELIISQKFRVVEMGTFRGILKDEIGASRASAGELTPEELKKIGEAAGIQGVFEGTVRDFEMVRIGQDSFPLITLEVRLLDAATGQVVWSTSVTKRGGPKMPILGWGEIHTLGEMANSVARSAVGRLPW
jgi:TolB-like protein